MSSHQLKSVGSTERFDKADAEDDNKKSLGTFQLHTKNLAIWGGFLTFSFAVFFFISSGDFSFLLTYASLMRCFAFCLLNYKMWSTKSAKGLSIKTLEIYVVVFISRLASILRHQGYLPFDKSGDWFYHAVEIMSLLAVSVTVFGVLYPFAASYQAQLDTFGNLFLPPRFGATYILVPCILLAIFIQPSLNKEYFSDACWAGSMYLEAAAMLPQIYMFQKQSASMDGSVVEVLIGHTVFALGFSRIFELMFWVGSFKELVDVGGSRIPGYMILVSQLIHLAIMGDFFYYYFQSLRKGVPIQLPTHLGSANV